MKERRLPRFDTSKELTFNLVANIASLAFLAVAGIALNIVIGRYYGPADLGLFNVVFALFIFASQLGSAGIQYSTLRMTSLHREDDDAHSIFSSAVLIVIGTSSATVVIAALAVPLVALVFDVDGITRGYLLSLPGLWCFSVNKVLLAFINGRGAMLAFAVFQSSRYLLMIAALLAVMTAGVGGAGLPVILTISEVVLLILLLVHLRGFFTRRAAPTATRALWRSRHLRFGLLAMPSGVMAELNTRVDILLLGAILGGVQTGIYSIAILLAEGYGQVVFVVRNVINPLLGSIVEQRDQVGLSRLVRNVGGATLLIMVVGGAFLVALFPLFDRYLLLDRFADARVPLAILVAGIGFTGPFMIFSMIMSQGGRPGYYTTLTTFILVINIVFNLIGVYTLGMVGAAIGTGLSYLAGATVLVLLTRRLFGLRLLP